MPTPTPEAAAAKAAKAALARTLRERVSLWADLDAELGKLIDQALATIVAQLAAAPTDYQQWVLPRLAAGIQQIADAMAASAATKASGGLRQAWQLGLDLVDHPVAQADAAMAALRAAPGLDLLPLPIVGLGVPSLTQLRALQAVNTHQITGASSDLVNAINRQLGQVVLGVQSPHQAMQAVATLMPDRTKNQVRGIVTTNLGTAFNTASFESLKAQAKRDPKIKKQWRRSGKLHSRWNHDLADGQVQEVETPFELHGERGGTVTLMYPADPAAPVGEVIHCGCVVLPWKASWKMHTPAKLAFTPAEIKAKREAAAEREGKRLATRPKTRPKTPVGARSRTKP